MSSKPPLGHFSVLYFATASSFTRKSSENLPAPLPALKLFETLEKQYPGIQKSVLSSCAVTINLEYIDLGEEQQSGDLESLNLIIEEGDEVAIIPPVSSG